MSEYTWPLVPDPTPPPGGGSAPTPEARTSPTGRLFGRALLRPFQRDQKNSLATGSGTALHRSRIGQILGTELGELDYDSALGSRIRLLEQRPLDETTQELARYYVEDALRQYTGVRVTRVERKLRIEGPVQVPNATDTHVSFVPVDTRGAPTGVEDTVVVRGK